MKKVKNSIEITREKIEFLVKSLEEARDHIIENEKDKARLIVDILITMFENEL
ncbi:MAG: hypothetical protein QXY47_05345 [Thermoplasmata archaeon]